jgi:hypothetical protein
MPESSKDHTRSLLPYQAILQACEEEYRTTSSAKRNVVLISIAEQITEAATAAGATVAGGDNLQKVSRMATCCWHQF